jgi:hypothetical protein
MNDISKKKELIRKAYPTKTWSAKVDNMPDNQIIAVFFRLQRQGKLKL